MKTALPALLVTTLLAGCVTTDRFSLIESGTEYGPFLFRTGSNVRIGDKTYKVKRLVSRDQYLTDRMKSCIIPTIDFRDAHIADVVAYCRESDVIVDTDEYMANPRIDICLVLPAEARKKVPLVTFSARFISIYKTMEVMAELTGLEFTIEDGHAWLKYK